MAERDGNTAQLARTDDTTDDRTDLGTEARPDSESDEELAAGTDESDDEIDETEPETENQDEDEDLETVAEQRAREARRARRASTASGAVLTLAGSGASAMRFSSGAPASAALAYAVGAVICATVAVLGWRGRTKRALVGLIAGVLVMAIGDQLD
ncbi:hypothetical protein [Streptomyces jeddahensis]|uniref:Uncharacterized protein n=1 Tax=Streptomyces jeddahensis TaxID=1716141 RepID=A0A177I0B4_9ACTN|nr:hypothetical protein [Streptomyces jeddahensis]OAH15848.1 hypothetical protein STSP_07790 [Streptomyces jeddahensis]